MHATAATRPYLRAKGPGPRRIVHAHALRNAGPSIVTVIGIQVGLLLGGAIVIEQPLGLPGMGKRIVTGIVQRNDPVLQAGLAQPLGWDSTKKMWSSIWTTWCMPWFQVGSTAGVW